MSRLPSRYCSSTMTCVRIHGRALSSSARLLRQRSAAQHLFDQAAKEEREEARNSSVSKARHHSPVVPDADVWTGEERPQDAVLRMLVSSSSVYGWRFHLREPSSKLNSLQMDSYKPLKVEGWQPKRKMPQPTQRAVLDLAQDAEAEAEDDLEALSQEPVPEAAAQGATEAESVAAYPWLVTYKPPKHYTGLGGLRNPKRRIRAPTNSRVSAATRIANLKEQRVDRGWGDRQSTPQEEVCGTNVDLKHHQSLPDSMLIYTSSQILVHTDPLMARQFAFMALIKTRSS